MSSAQDSSDFYDDYVEHQEQVGVNERHRAILRQMLASGLKPTDRVLEIGCGIGTLTEIAAAELPGGSILGVDLSPRSIEVGRQRLGSRANVELRAGDVVEMELDGMFDAIVMPDVIEHIPLEHHNRLFERVAAWLKPTGFVVINYPDPHYLAWCHENRPDLVQLIDQPIHADVLTANVYPHGLYLHSLQSYSIWIEEGDYVMVVLRQTRAKGAYTPVIEPQPSIVRRAAGRARRLLG